MLPRMRIPCWPTNCRQSLELPEARCSFSRLIWFLSITHPHIPLLGERPQFLHKVNGYQRLIVPLVNHLRTLRCAIGVKDKNNIIAMPKVPESQANRSIAPHAQL